MNQRIVQLGKERHDWRGLLQLAQEERSRMNNVNLATLLMQLARMAPPEISRHPQFLQLVQAVAITCEQQGLRWLQYRETANIVYALGRLLGEGRHQPGPSDPVLDNAVHRILTWLTLESTANELIHHSSTTTQQLANIAWAMAKLNFKTSGSHAVLAAIDARATWLLQNGTPQEVSNILWAMGKLQYNNINNNKATPHSLLIHNLIVSYSTWLVENGSPQSISNTLWACAVMGYSQITPLLSAIEQQLSNNSNWNHWNTQDLANAAWACGTLMVDPLLLPRGLFQTVEQNAQHLIRTGTTQEVANTIWACAKVSWPAPELCRAVHQHAATRLVTAFNPQELANTAWALTVLGSTEPDYFMALQDHASLWLHEKSEPRHVSQIVWSFATLGWDAPQMFANLDQQANQRRYLSAMNCQDLSMALWAFATLGFPAPELWEKLLADGGGWEMLLRDGSIQELCNTIWAMATSAPGLPGSETKLVKLWHRALQLCQQDDTQLFPDALLFQLAQTQLLAGAEGLAHLQIPEFMTARMDQILKNKVLRQSQITPELSELLQEIGFGDHEWEVAPYIIGSSSSGTPQQQQQQSLVVPMLAIDVACRERRVAIEYDGPSHYLRSFKHDNQDGEQRTRTENGATQAKRRVLQRLGWTVVNIDYRDYQLEIAQGRAEVRAWLRNKLLGAGVALASSASTM